MKKLFRFLGKLLLILVNVVLLVLIAVGAINLISLRDFYAGSGRQEFPMAGVSDPKYDQQGLDYDEQSNLFFFSGYMKDGTASRIYLLDGKTGKEQKCVLLQKEDGTPHVNHSGGIAVCGRYVYLAGSRDECLYVFERQAVLDAEDGASVKCVGQISLRKSAADGLRASFIGRSGNTIYVGEFSRCWIPYYRLRDSHRLQNAAGQTNALMLAFEADRNAPLGLSEQPVAAFALPEKVQGVAVTEDGLMLSKSLLYLPSRMETVTPVENGTLTVLETEVPLYRLETVKVSTVPPMSEGVVCKDGRVYISSELCHFLIPHLGRLWGGEWCWSIAE